MFTANREMESMQTRNRCKLKYVSASPDDIQFAHVLVMELEKNLDRIL